MMPQSPIDDFTEFIDHAVHFAASIDPKDKFPNPTASGLEKIANSINLIHNSGYYGAFIDRMLSIWYSVTKNHYLENGNKRMGYACFVIYFLLHSDKQQKLILTKEPKALCLYIAGQSSSQKDTDRDVVIERLRQDVFLQEVGTPKPKNSKVEICHNRPLAQKVA